MSPGIVRRRTAVLNIPEGDCCGEAVEGGLIRLIEEENGVLSSFVIMRVRGGIRLPTNYPVPH
jgi:hypothetical protein